MAENPCSVAARSPPKTCDGVPLYRHRCKRCPRALKRIHVRPFATATSRPSVESKSVTTKPGRRARPGTGSRESLARAAAADSSAIPDLGMVQSVAGRPRVRDGPGRRAGGAEVTTPTPIRRTQSSRSTSVATPVAACNPTDGDPSDGAATVLGRSARPACCLYLTSTSQAFGPSCQLGDLPSRSRDPGAKPEESAVAAARFARWVSVWGKSSARIRVSVKPKLT